MGLLIAQSFWLAMAVTLAGIAHMVIVKKNLLSVLNVPLDGGACLRGERIFGDNKTWRGVAFMIVASALFGAIQGALFGPWAQRVGAACIDFASVGRWLRSDSEIFEYAVGYATVNAVLGLGYVLGELPNSFLKRQIGIKPGTTSAGIVGSLFLLLDQADSVLVALGLASLTFSMGWGIFVVGTICLTGLHLLLNAALFLGRIRKNL